MRKILRSSNDDKKSASKNRMRLSADERRELLLDAGQALFGTKHYDDVSLAEICQHAGVSRPLIQHYFGNKREFHRQVFARALDRLSARVHVKGPSLDPAMTQQRMFEYFEFAVAHPAGVLVGSQSAAYNDDINTLVTEFIDRTTTLILEQIPDPLPSYKAALAVWSQMNIALTLRIIQTSDIDERWAAQFSTQMLFAALKSAHNAESTSSS